MSTITTKEENLERYAGKWVALVDGQVVEHAVELPILMRKIREKRFKRRPSVFLVPRKDEGPYVLIVI